MKIIIVQAEIETAIQDYILGQMTINDDQELSVELSATRGADGMTAEIVVKPKVTAEAPVRKKPATAAASKPATVTKTAAPAPEKVADEPATVVDEPAVDVDATSIAEQAEAVEEAPVDTAPAGKSIFGSLPRPTNS